MVKHFLLVIFLAITVSCASQKNQNNHILTGAEQLDHYLPKLGSKEIGLFVNHTSLINQTHLTDTLLSLGLDIKRVFSPEHGFRGNKPDGEKVEGETSKYFELVSLYGSNKKPKDDQIQDLDLVVIDIQDVGVRFYTYASTMTYLMEACAKNNVPVMVLDRPNPNGNYVDGPVLDEQFESFVGLHPIPLVHGLTLGELALMINGEGWLENGTQCNLEIIPNKNWSHDMPYSLPVKPSPNLPNDLAISLYPSLALFEGTIVSVGRGTDHPFQVIGHPKYKSGNYAFTPQPNAGSKYPPLEGEECFGISFLSQEPTYTFTLKYLINFYNELRGKTKKPFFNDYFPKLAGTDKLQQQIEAGMSEEEIRKSWEDGLTRYRTIREKYLLYEDQR